MSMHNLPWDVVAAWSTLVKFFVAFGKLICQILWPGPVITGVFLHLIFPELVNDFFFLLPRWCCNG